MAIETRPLPYRHDDTDFEALLVSAAGASSRPAVILFPTIMGRADLELGFARRLAELGYAGIVTDLYGVENIGRSREECRGLMNALLNDRPRLQSRLATLLETVRGQAEVDPARVAAIGYCFGGLCALDLARTGADLKGVASFHGLFTPPGNMGGTPIRAKVIVFHGWDDPMVPPADVEALGRELSEAGADWQIHAYGQTMHGFTNPGANSPENGLQYDPVAEARSWRSLVAFLEECFG
jgi:dienelactone hydrolase